MPSEEALKQQAEEWKAKGNEAFQKGSIDEAIQAYSHGVVACDRILPSSSASSVKATLLSNRAMCYLKIMQFQSCIDDCTTALELDPSDAKLRCKISFRRAKASFLLSNLPTTTTTATTTATATTIDADALLQDAAKDLLHVVQFDPKNSEANQLLVAVRAQHKQQQSSGHGGAAATTPVSKTLQALEKGIDVLHHLKLLLGLLDNDPMNAPMELGRRQGVPLLFELASTQQGKSATMAMQCLSLSGSHPGFCRAYLNHAQPQILKLVQEQEKMDADNSNPNLVVSLLSVLDRLLLHLDRDDPDQDISGSTKIDSGMLVETVNSALRGHALHQDRTVVRAVLDVLTCWTAGTERDATIRAALANSQQPTDPLLPLPITAADVRGMSPQATAAYRKRTNDKRLRDETWAFDRGIFFCGNPQDPSSGLRHLLQAAHQCQDHVVRREVTVVVGRILAGIGQDPTSDDKLKQVLLPFLQDAKNIDEDEGVVIEEVYNDDEEEQKQAAVDKENEEVVLPLEIMMQRAIITCALLLSKKEVGAWAFGGSGWEHSIEHLEVMIDSNDSRAMCLASEVVSAASTLEAAAPVIAGFIQNGFMEKLLKSEDRDIRSGAASAIAKVGLANKETGKDEGEQLSLLQGACDLLEDKGDSETAAAADSNKGSSKLHHFSSFATSSVERAVEMISYLIGNTFIKEELAAGFQALGAPHSALERLVEVSSIPNAGESLSGFGLATIFQNLAVTNLQLRKEMFEGKEVTMEQYDEMQKMGKSEEEKELLDLERDTDTQASCDERIRRMASANVPRAMVTLMEGASDHTMEQLVLAMNRMAVDPSVRGIMIQQGILSACIKVEKNEGPTETDTMRKVIRLARHCIAKLLVTTNPTLLTSAQRMGSVRPLLQLVRDIHASDLQQFEALLALTNIAGSGDDAKARIVSEKGIAPLNYAMFSDHDMVQQAATECMANLVGNEAMMQHLAVSDNLKLWLAFASDYDEHYECARAAAGGLAMATQDKAIAEALASLEKFGPQIKSILECGRLEIMHRALYIVLNLMVHGGECRESVVKEGIPAFCEAYIANYISGQALEDMEFSEEEQALLPVTVDVAKKIVSVAGTADTDS